LRPPKNFINIIFCHDNKFYSYFQKNDLFSNNLYFLQLIYFPFHLEPFLFSNISNKQDIKAIINAKIINIIKNKQGIITDENGTKIEKIVIFLINSLFFSIVSVSNKDIIKL